MDDRPIHCDRPMQKNGKKGDRQQWKCPVCKASCRDGQDSSNKGGRPKVKTPLSAYERVKRCRLRKSRALDVDV